MRKTIYKARTRTGSYHDFSGMTTNQNPDISLNSSVINNGEIENKTNSKGSNFKRTTSLKTGVSGIIYYKTLIIYYILSFLTLLYIRYRKIDFYFQKIGL